MSRAKKQAWRDRHNRPIPPHVYLSDDGTLECSSCGGRGNLTPCQGGYACTCGMAYVLDIPPEYGPYLSRGTP